MLCSGWISALTGLNKSIPVGIIMILIAALFTASAVISLIMFKKVMTHTAQYSTQIKLCAVTDWQIVCLYPVCVCRYMACTEQLGPALRKLNRNLPQESWPTRLSRPQLPTLHLMLRVEHSTNETAHWDISLFSLTMMYALMLYAT